VDRKPGTLIAVPLPAADLCDRGTLSRTWTRAFSLLNPHCAVRISKTASAGMHANSPRAEIRNSYRATVAFPGEWRKFLAKDLASPWWYGGPALGKQVFAHVAAAKRGGRDLPLREYVRQFRGLSGTAKAKIVCDQFPLVERLSDFHGQDDVDRLLAAMLAQTQAPSPGVLGEVGEAHFRDRFERWFGVKRFWYKKVVGVVDGVCYVVEAALAETRRGGGRVFHGVNFSPTFDDPLAGTVLKKSTEFVNYGVNGFLESCHFDASDHAAAFHLICPVIETLDKGKTRLKVPEEVADAAAKALWAVARDVYREKEQREKDAAKAEASERRRQHEREKASRASEMTLLDAVFKVLPRAVADAAGGLGRVSAHTLYYHVRR
jgi:uncharacterized protein (DUF2267 family)